MQGAVNRLGWRKHHLSGVAMLVAAAFLYGCGGGGGLVERLPGLGDKGDGQVKQEKQVKKKPRRAAKEPDDTPVTDVDQRAVLLQELKALREQLDQRKVGFQDDLIAAKAELARRQAAGEIDPAKVRLAPAQIRDTQLSELEALKAELERRRSSGQTKQEIIATALTENEEIYRYVDACLTRQKGDFRGVFDGRSDLTKIVSEKNSQVYQNADKSLLILTSSTNCDISFTGENLDNYVTGLVHILETQGGIVEMKKLAGITAVRAVHPRGNFRLASGEKVIGQGGSTNFYTTITAL